MISHVSFGKARRLAIDTLGSLLKDEQGIEKAVLGQDLFGRLRVILFVDATANEEALDARIGASMAQVGSFWTGEVWFCSPQTSRADRLIYDSAWDDGVEVPDIARLRIDDRTRTRTAWLPKFTSPPWNAATDWKKRKPQNGDEPLKDGPPITRVELSWSDKNLYAMLIKHLANLNDEWFNYCNTGKGSKLSFTHDPILMHIPVMQK